MILVYALHILIIDYGVASFLLFASLPFGHFEASKRGAVYIRMMGVAPSALETHNLSCFGNSGYPAEKSLKKRYRDKKPVLRGTEEDLLVASRRLHCGLVWDVNELGKVKIR